MLIANLHLGRIEVRDAGCASKEHHISLLVVERNAWTILISLQSIRALEAFHLLGVGTETGKTIVGAYPEISLIILFYGTDALVGQSVGCGIDGQFLRLDVKAVESLRCSYPNMPHSIVQNRVDILIVKDRFTTQYCIPFMRPYIESCKSG